MHQYDFSKAVDILRYEFDSHRRHRSSFYHFLPPQTLFLESDDDSYLCLCLMPIPNCFWEDTGLGAVVERWWASVQFSSPALLIRLDFWIVAPVKW